MNAYHGTYRGARALEREKRAAIPLRGFAALYSRRPCQDKVYKRGEGTKRGPK